MDQRDIPVAGASESGPSRFAFVHSGPSTSYVPLAGPSQLNGHPGVKREPPPTPTADDAPIGRSAPKAKRKQFQACDVCRLRRVRCDRDAADEPCRGCRRRGLVCVRNYNEAKAAEPRGGKLLDVAYATYGAPPTPGGVEHYVPTVEPADEAPLFSYHSPEGRLGHAQSNDFLQTALVATYADHLVHTSPLCADFEGFLARFEAAGRRFGQLDVDDRATATLVVALAGRVTDMPLIAGAHAPPIRRIAAVNGEARDPLAFGAHREPVCRQLEHTARQAIERTFMRREATVDTVTALVAMQNIDDIENERNPAACRIYSAAAIEHIRAIALKPNKSPEEHYLLRGPVTRGFIISDSMWAYDKGRGMQVTDEDLAILVPSLLKLSPADAIAATQTQSPFETYMMLIDHMFMFARTLRRHFTSPMARLRGTPPDLGVFRSLLHSMQLIFAAERLSWSPTPAEAWRRQSMRAVHMGLTSEVTFLADQARLARDAAPDAETRAALAQYCVDIAPVAGDALRRMADMCGRLYAEGMLLGNNLLWSPLSDLAADYLAMPANTEGGAVDFTLDDKIAGAEQCARPFRLSQLTPPSMLRCIRELAWSWPCSRRALPELEARLSHVYAARDAQRKPPPPPQTPAARPVLPQLSPPSGHRAAPAAALDWLLNTSPVHPSAVVPLEMPTELDWLPSSASSSSIGSSDVLSSWLSS